MAVAAILEKFQMTISPQRLTIYLYSAHRAVIFAIAQLSCHITHHVINPSTTFEWLRTELQQILFDCLDIVCVFAQLSVTRLRFFFTELIINSKNCA